MVPETFWALSGMFLGMGLLLMLFGVAYNRLVHKIEIELRVEGLTAFLVSVGCLVTVGLSYPLIAVILHYTTTGPLITAGFILLAELYAFTASGLPMIVGAARRYIAMRQQHLAYRKPNGN